MDEISERDIQTTRLLLMMYRQGWIDAAAHLNIAANDLAKRMKKQYNELVEITGGE